MKSASLKSGDFLLELFFFINLSSFFANVANACIISTKKLVQRNACVRCYFERNAEDKCKKKLLTVQQSLWHTVNGMGALRRYRCRFVSVSRVAQIHNATHIDRYRASAAQRVRAR